MEAIVTIINHNIINQNALKIFILGLQKHHVKFEKLFVLAPSSQIDESLQNWLKRNHAIFVEYDLLKSDDPYFAKFLLKRFLNDPILDNIEIVTYMDPDHIVLKTIDINSLSRRGLTVSSENSEEIKFPHFNTSFISGHKKNWLKILKYWRCEYEKIKNTIGYRFREEIAFSLAAEKSEVCLIQAPIEFQSCFKEYSEECQIFHYGGEYFISKKIKSCLVKNNMIKNIEKIKSDTKNNVEKLLIDEFLLILNKLEKENEN